MLSPCELGRRGGSQTYGVSLWFGLNCKKDNYET